MTLVDLINQVIATVTTAVPDLGVYIAAGVVISLGVFMFRRFSKGGR